MLLLAKCFLKRFIFLPFLPALTFLFFPWTGFLLPIEHAGLTFTVWHGLGWSHTPARAGLQCSWETGEAPRLPQHHYICPPARPSLGQPPYLLFWSSTLCPLYSWVWFCCLVSYGLANSDPSFFIIGNLCSLALAGHLAFSCCAFSASHSSVSSPVSLLWCPCWALVRCLLSLWPTVLGGHCTASLGLTLLFWLLENSIVSLDTFY